MRRSHIHYHGAPRRPFGPGVSWPLASQPGRAQRGGSARNLDLGGGGEADRQPPLAGGESQAEGHMGLAGLSHISHMAEYPSE